MCETKEMARYAKALAHPARIKILKYLSRTNSCITGDFVKVLPLAQSTVSQHIKELKEAGLINSHETPPQVNYCINRKNWERARKLLLEFFDQDDDFKPDENHTL